ARSKRGRPCWFGYSSVPISAARRSRTPSLSYLTGPSKPTRTRAAFSWHPCGVLISLVPSSRLAHH
ncbi:hypothetical protein FOZ63_005309, partial [Perkinsus olseni]